MAPEVIFECEIASPEGVIVQCTIHKNLRFKNSITHSLTRLSRQLAMAPAVIFESCLARRCDCEALDTLVLSAAGRGVVEVAAGQLCVLVQCTIHKNLHFKSSITHSLTRLSRQLVMAPAVIFECEIASHAGVIVQCTIHKSLRFKNSITHSLTRLSRQLVMAPGVIFGSEIASPAGVIVQCTIHKHLHFKNSITHSLTHSLTRLSRQLVMGPGVTFGSQIASPAGVIVQCTIHKHLHFKNPITHSLTCLSRHLG